MFFCLKSTLDSILSCKINVSFGIKSQVKLEKNHLQLYLRMSSNMEPFLPLKSVKSIREEDLMSTEKSQCLPSKAPDTEDLTVPWSGEFFLSLIAYSNLSI